MKSLSDVKFSTLDLVPVRANGSPAQSLRNSLDLAQHVEKFGYHRFWVAEHHNMDGIASSATSVLLVYLAGGTSTIRVGSGGVMLPTTRSWRTPSSSAPWKAFTLAVLTWAWGARPAPTR